MSGLEILGVAASAVQVAQVSLAIVTSLTSLFNQIRDAPKVIQTRLLQVQTLVEISRLIASMPQLQTAEVEAILQSCSKDEEELQGVLQGLVVEKDGSPIKKWAKAIGGVVTEKKIVGLLLSLEVGKSSLALCISRIDSTLLYDIDSRLEVMRRNLEDVALSVKDELPRLRTAIEYLTDQHQKPPITAAPISEKTAACLSSLGAIDQTAFLMQMLNRSKKAGEWILRNRKYVSWLESSEADLLWITAKAGCGKTTLASHISQKVKVNQSSQAQASKMNDLKPVVSFFFFHKSNLKVEGRATGALRNIVSQLVDQVPDVFPTVLERYELLSSRGNFEWSSENLLSMVGDMLEHIPANSSVYIILDAVDECEPESRRMLLDWLNELVDNGKSTATSTTTTSRPLFKIVITSRPDESVFDSLADFPTLEMTISDTAADMHTLIQSRIGNFSRRRHLDTKASQGIINFLEGNAHGMFLWVVLIIQDLERRDERLSDEVIAAKLSSIPLTLINTYDTILRNVSPSRKKDTWRILRWLLFARRGLTFPELEAALCLETGVSRWHNFAGDVNFLCGSFVRFDGPRGEINIIHQTARDFLESFVMTADPEDVAGLDMATGAANAHLAQTCIQYLLRDEELLELRGLLIYKWGPKYKPAVENFLGRHPFLYYAIESWASHVRALGTPSMTLSNLTRALLATDTRRDCIMLLTYFINHHGSSNVPMHQHPIHLASYFNFPWLVELYISQNWRVVHAVCTMNDTPLIWASEMGSTACVKILLDAGANPNNFEYDGWSSLHWAARNGHLEVVKLLIDHGASLGQQDSKGHTPLEWAADREHWDVVNALKRRVWKEELAKLDKFMKDRDSVNNRGSVNIGQLRDARP